MPHLQKIYEELKDKGFDIIAVNARDPEATVEKYFRESGFKFRTVLGGQGEQYTVGKAYGVRAYPTNFLVDANGKVLWRGVGFREAELRSAIQKGLGE